MNPLIAFSTAAAAVGLAALPATAEGAALPSTPTVARFSDTAGFEHARVGPLEQRTPIRVGLAPEFWGDPQTVEDRIAWLDPVLDAWNDAAGWELLVQVNDDTAEVTFSTGEVEDVCPPNAGACAWMTERTYIGFDHCYVAFFPWYPTADVVAHELGHCLGFVDVPDPTPDGYQGIMIHRRAWGATPDNPYDIASLVEAGYREVP